MKKMILGLALLVSFGAFASEEKTAIFPRVYNAGYAIQVQVWNHTDRAVNCSGFINYTLMDGTRDSAYYSDYVFARQNTFRMIYPRGTSERINWVSHSIYCF